MAKLMSVTLAAAAFLLFLVAAEATIRATVIIDEDNQGGRRGGQDCSEQIQEQQNLRHCQQYMMQQAQRQGGGGGGRRDDEEHFGECCNQLKKLDRQCTCQGLKQALENMPRGQVREQDLQSMWRLAENLPGQCRTEPSSCQFGRQVPAWF